MQAVLIPFMQQFCFLFAVIYFKQVYFEILVCAWCRPIGLPWFGNHWLSCRLQVVCRYYGNAGSSLAGSALRTLFCTPHADSKVCKLMQHTRVVHTLGTVSLQSVQCASISFLQFLKSLLPVDILFGFDITQWIFIFFKPSQAYWHM